MRLSRGSGIESKGLDYPGKCLHQRSRRGGDVTREDRKAAYDTEREFGGRSVLEAKGRVSRSGWEVSCVNWNREVAEHEARE